MDPKRITDRIAQLRASGITPLRIDMHPDDVAAVERAILDSGTAVSAHAAAPAGARHAFLLADVPIYADDTREVGMPKVRGEQCPFNICADLFGRLPDPNADRTNVSIVGDFIRIELDGKDSDPVRSARNERILAELFGS